MLCPKCRHPHRIEETLCPGCGLVFEKWAARQQQIATEPPSAQANRTSKKSNRPLDENAAPNAQDEWARRYSRWAMCLLLIGILLPLRKHSMLFDASFFVWQWELGGWTSNPAILAALGTYSEGAHPIAWAALPLVACFLLWQTSLLQSRLSRALGNTLIGFATLAFLLLVFIQENERLGLVFLPPTFGAGMITLIAITTGALIAAANHVVRLEPEWRGARLWTGVSGIVLLGINLLFMAGGSGVWKTWSMWGIYSLVTIYALLATARLFGPQPGNASISGIRIIGRLVVILTPLAIILSQLSDQNEFSVFVVQAGGNTASTLFATLKAFLIFFGAALAMAVGMANRLLPNNQTDG